MQYYVISSPETPGVLCRWLAKDPRESKHRLVFSFQCKMLAPNNATNNFWCERRMIFVRREEQKEKMGVWVRMRPSILGLCGVISQYGLCELGAVDFYDGGEFWPRKSIQSFQRNQFTITVLSERLFSSLEWGVSYPKEFHALLSWTLCRVDPSNWLHVNRPYIVIPEPRAKRKYSRRLVQRVSIWKMTERLEIHSIFVDFTGIFPFFVITDVRLCRANLFQLPSQAWRYGEKKHFLRSRNVPWIDCPD